jgi:uncharacterized membrane protein YhaH (DUF805 family)
MLSLKKSFTIRDRASRSEYVALFPVELMYFVLCIFIGSASPPLSCTLLLLSMFIHTVPRFSLSIRRLHNCNLGGHNYLVLFVPLIGPIFFLITMLSKGTEGPNHYGPDPNDPQ